MYLFYNLILFFCAPCIFLGLFIRYGDRFRKELLLSLKERLGIGLKKYLQSDNKPYIWIHAASVGEIQTVEPLINELHDQFPDYRLIISTLTLAGKEIATKKQLADSVIFAPFDLLFSVKSVLAVFRPKIVFIVETELWPNFIRQAKMIGSRVILVNGRISNKSYPLYKLLKPLWKKVFAYVDQFLMREEQDKKRIINLGALRKKTRVVGNMKYDRTTNKKISVSHIYQRFILKEDDIVLVAGSIREKEEEIILEAYKEILKQVPQSKLIFAPRHLERVPLITQLLQEKNISFTLKTSLVYSSPFTPSCMVLDTYGELYKAYAMATIVFVGGSLVPLGGQNILEPAFLGKPILFGPYMDNFQECAKEFKNRGAAIEVKDKEELVTQIMTLLRNKELRNQMGEKAKELVELFRGATQRTLDLVSPYLKK